MASEPSQVHIDIVLAPDGIIRRVRADGHAGKAAAGNNLLCAAITVLLRSLFESWSRYPGVTLDGAAARPGQLAFRLEAFDPALTATLRGGSDILLVGLAGLQREYPDGLVVEIE
ncbi:MAG: hypothetical protein A2087_14365 [Spirochaetes bacterium GWD1_61_31]|nr:MAG: hypothetical protein A2004_05645 [Spirochaetes bacterium GWC1_61_12]OHD34858.1 MAG: hypothetical protein A2087_14365 [Spirochaetes bacterium GWD1_61_31]OHD60332.1 MAG: hypothetical protein A2Y32_14755 [Spirochaetes bacterium GWF1_60_12]